MSAKNSSGRRGLVRPVAAGIAILALATSALLAVRISQLRGVENIEQTVLVRSPKVIKFTSLGFNGLAASVYWTRAVQYFGSKHHEGAVRFDLLAPLLNLTADLDPNLTVAYEFGSIFLAQKPPEGAGQPDAAVQFVERGIRANPDDWKLYYHLGFIHYIERHDYAAAADAFDRGSRVPGAHPWMKIMAAMLLHRSGEIETSRFLWTRIYESSDDPMIKQNALIRLLALRVDAEVGILQNAVDTFRSRHGANPANWGELVRDGLLPRMPVDPGGLPYRLTADGSVELQDFRRFPFATRGLPKGAKPVEMMTEEASKVPEKAKEAVTPDAKAKPAPAKETPK